MKTIEKTTARILRRPSKLDEQDPAGGARSNSCVTFSGGPLHTDVQVSDDQLELINNSSVRKQDVAGKTCMKRWMIGKIPASSAT